MMTLKHKFVENIPSELEEGVIYVSIPFETVIHKCCCGCGNEVVTPLAPSQWSLTFNGESITLDPSIGNWSLNCRSHYFIRKNKVIWSNMYDDAEIEKVKKSDYKDNVKYFEGRNNNDEIINNGKVLEPERSDRADNMKEIKTVKKEVFEEKTSFWKSLLSKFIGK